jgi:hypothetical protein
MMPYAHSLASSSRAARALVRSRNGFHYSTADPWELRSVGTIVCHGRALSPAVFRVARREKPTLLVTRSPSLLGSARRAARRLGVTTGDAHLPIPPAAVAAELYPELPMRAPTSALQETATLAIAAVLYAQSSPRHYAPRRHRPAEHAA